VRVITDAGQMIGVMRFKAVAAPAPAAAPAASP